MGSYFKDLNRVEAENIMNAQRKYFQRSIEHPMNWFRTTELKSIHEDMFGNVWEWAGAYRKSITSIGIKPVLIPMKLAEFCDEVHGWFKHPVELTPLEMSARIHHRLVFIHPFENGNGRFSRFVADYFLLAWKCSYPSWPRNLHQESGIRNEYIQTLKNADRGEYNSLMNFMKKFGASEPELDELFKNRFYQTFLQGNTGIALVKALLRTGAYVNVKTRQSAEKSGLSEIIQLFDDLNTNR